MVKVTEYSHLDQTITISNQQPTKGTATKTGVCRPKSSGPENDVWRRYLLCTSGKTRTDYIY